MWTKRWGHATVIYNQTTYPLNYLSEKENSERKINVQPVIVLLGGDDYMVNKEDQMQSSHVYDSSRGGFRNDIWVSKPPKGPESWWKIVLSAKSTSKTRRSDHEVEDKATEAEMQSEMVWYQSNPGKLPPPVWPSTETDLAFKTPVPFDDWIKCQDYFEKKLFNFNAICRDEKSKHPEKTWKNDNMWSPRRGHGAVVANGKLYVIGGRAQEYTSIHDQRRADTDVGTEDSINFDRNVESTLDYPTSFRKETILKNDIWVSEDGLGKDWKLVTAGCKDPQRDIILQTEVWSREIGDTTDGPPKKYGSHGSKCSKSSDCYGDAICMSLQHSLSDSGKGVSLEKTCVCPMFNVRENHSVSVQNTFFTDDSGKTFSEDYIYIVGGFTTVRQSFCSNRSCGSLNNGYRLALDDAWVSNDGSSWVQIKEATFSRQKRYGPGINIEFLGRGGHAALLTHADYFQQNKSLKGSNVDSDKLWIFGGETSNPKDSKTEFLNDIWSIRLPSEPCCKATRNCHHSHHPLRYQDIAGNCLPSPSDWKLHKTVTATNNVSYSQWSGRSGHIVLHEPSSSRNNFEQQIYLYGGKNSNHTLSDVWTWDLNDESPWRRDFEPGQWYRTEYVGGTLHFGPKEEDEDQTQYLLHHQTNTKFLGMPYQFYLSSKSNISDLSQIFVPMPQETNDWIMDNSLPSVVPLFNGDENQIQSLQSLGIFTIQDLSEVGLYTMLKMRGFDFPGEPEVKEIPDICPLWLLATSFIEKCEAPSPSRYSSQRLLSIRNRYSKLSVKDIENMLCRDGICRIEEETDWDGCTPLAGLDTIDVHGIGDVSVPSDFYDVGHILEEMNCRQSPGPRYMAGGVSLGNKIMIIGGRGDNNPLSSPSLLYHDVWERDDSFPLAIIVTRPETYTSDSIFRFNSNEDSAKLFEYKVVDVVERLDVTNWIKTDIGSDVDVSWLDDKEGGPGRGLYGLYVRAIDASGNKDYRYSTSTNVHIWMYIPPPPWGLIFGMTFGAVTLIGGLHFEFRRRAKKKALERYARRKMKRRFKLQAIAGESKNGDWREYYQNDRKRGKDRSKAKVDNIKKRENNDSPARGRRRKTSSSVSRRKNREDDEYNDGIKREGRRRREKDDVRRRRKTKRKSKS